MACTGRGRLLLFVFVAFIVCHVGADWQAERDKAAFATIEIVPLSGGKKMTDYGFDFNFKSLTSQTSGRNAGNPSITLREKSKGETIQTKPQTNSKSSNTKTDFTCSFENEDLCGISQSVGENEIGGKLDWSFGNGPTPSSNTGPLSAHSGSGYIFLEASGVKTGDSAVIAFPPVKTDGSHCLNFWYSMHGFHTGKLRVFKETNGKSEDIWEREKEQGDKWLNAKEVIRLNRGDVVAFAAHRGTGYSGDIALDDVSLKSC